MNSSLISNRTDLEAELSVLDDKHSNALNSSSPNDAIYYSKIAILEFCAWIEEYQDAILKNIFMKKLITNKAKNELRSAIHSNHGFHYMKNFRPLLIKCIGLIELEKFEQIVNDDGSLDVLEGVLSQVRDARNDAAHIRLTKTTYQYDAPSKVISYLQRIEPILKKININALNVIQS